MLPRVLWPRAHAGARRRYRVPENSVGQRAPELQSAVVVVHVLQGLLMAAEVAETTVVTLGASVRAGQRLSACS